MKQFFLSLLTALTLILTCFAAKPVNLSSDVTGRETEPVQDLVETIVTVQEDYPDVVLTVSVPEKLGIGEKQGNLTEIQVVQETIEETEPEEEEEYFEFEEYSYSIYDMLQNELEIVPDYLLNYLYSNGWTVEITDEDLAEKFGYDCRICGLTEYDSKTIWIADYEFAIRRATIHEIGHAFAWETGRTDETEEFYRLFEEESANFSDCTSIGDGHETEDVHEYFASVFQNIFLDWDETYEEVPGTVEYIEGLIYSI